MEYIKYDETFDSFKQIMAITGGLPKGKIVVSTPERLAIFSTFSNAIDDIARVKTPEETASLTFRHYFHQDGTLTHEDLVVTKGSYLVQHGPLLRQKFIVLSEADFNLQAFDLFVEEWSACDKLIIQGAKLYHLRELHKLKNQQK